MTHHQVRSYHDALNYIYSFTDYEKKTAYLYTPERFDLRRVETLLDRLGNPHDRFKSIHIAGTKGKGSTTAIIAAVLTTAGFRTGIYTSPHLHTFCERIRIGPEMISRQQVAQLLQEMIPVIESVPQLTTFEIITALAFVYFARQGSEFAVIETGLGGRLDATNVIRPQVSVITSLSLDHTEVLGHTLAAIAREKAGIIKPGVPVISAPQPTEAQEIIEATCAERRSPLTVVGRDWTWKLVEASLDRQVFRVISDPSKADLCEPTYCLPLLGRHQLINATTAIAALHSLRTQGTTISAYHVAEGVAHVEWPARFEVLSREPALVVDGAHNPESARRLRETLEDYFPGRNTILIFGVSSDKDTVGILRELLPLTSQVIVMQSSHPRAASTKELSAVLASLGQPALLALDAEQALDMALEHSVPGNLICASGSLFVAADVRLAWARRNGTGKVPMTDKE